MPARPTSLAHFPRNWPRAIEAHVPRKFLRDILNRRRFGAAAPLSDECLWVDPREIRHHYVADPAKGAPRLRRQSSGLVLAGDWDLSRRPISDQIKAQSVRLHFEQGIAWEDTPVFAHLMGRIRAGQAPDDLHSEADVRARYAALDATYADLRQTGRLRPKTEMPDFFRREHGGILVHVARDGTLMRDAGGIHRFALARLLNLPRIPVQLGVTHLVAVRSDVLARYRPEK